MLAGVVCHNEMLAGIVCHNEMLAGIVCHNEMLAGIVCHNEIAELQFSTELSAVSSCQKHITMQLTKLCKILTVRIKVSVSSGIRGEAKVTSSSDGADSMSSNITSRVSKEVCCEKAVQQTMSR